MVTSRPCPQGIPEEMWADLTPWQRWYYSLTEKQKDARARKIQDGLRRFWHGEDAV